MYFDQNHTKASVSNAINVCLIPTWIALSNQNILTPRCPFSRKKELFRYLVVEFSSKVSNETQIGDRCVEDNINGKSENTTIFVDYLMVIQELYM